MRIPSTEYDELVARKQAEIRGNVTSEKLTESRCADDIKAITGGAFENDFPEIDAALKANPVPEYAQHPKKSRGWPKGKKRGPRKPKA